MQIVAKVTLSNSNFEDWSAFFDSYKDKRSEFVQNESVEKINENDKYFMDFRYLFWYCSFTAFSNSLICAFTQKLYLAALGRYVFGQPYFYIALSIFIGSKASELIKHPKIVYCLTMLISCGMLLKNFVDFGNANLHV